MELIKRIADADLLGGTPEYMNTVSRYGARGILIGELDHVAMMYMAAPNLYKLPGGGLNEGEDARSAFLREIQEETGYEAEITHELGYIEEHKIRNEFMQYSYCYIARARNNTHETTLSENEMQLGMAVKWMTMAEALEVMHESALSCDDYSARFMLLRDQTILERAAYVLFGGKSAEDIR